MELEEIKILLDKYLADEANAEERNLVENWYENLYAEELNFGGQDLSDLKSDLRLSLLTRIRKPRYAYLKLAVTAAAVLLIGIIIVFYNANVKPLQEGAKISVVANDISPGGNNAVLTLEDGSRILLNQANNGKLSKDGSILKKEDGLIAYTGKGEKRKTDIVAYNSIVTPKGGEYTVVLADGTKVWLNAASSLKYPTHFKGKQRSVELSGEAYFEVTKNPDMPFIVLCKKQTIEVLGTHFNVNAYTEEQQVTTTLLEGSVKVREGNDEALLKPGQQSVTFADGAAGSSSGIRVTEANTEEAIAWKNGWFQFEQADIKTVMSQIGRWYNVDVIYQGKIPDDHYKGKVSRSVKVSQVLKILETSGINFKIEGKTIIVK